MWSVQIVLNLKSVIENPPYSPPEFKRCRCGAYILFVVMRRKYLKKIMFLFKKTGYVITMSL